MFSFKKIVPFMAAGFLSFGGAVHAATTTYHFGSLLSGSSVPASTHFADLIATDNGGGNWSLNLNTLPAFAATFGASAFLGSIAVDNASTFAGLGTSNVSGGVSSVGKNPGGGPGGDFDFRYVFGGGSDKLIGGESVSWDVVGMFGTPGNGQLALHVQGIGPNDNSAWYVSPVPEPETYAMLLAGLGLVGYMVRRRRVSP